MRKLPGLSYIKSTAHSSNTTHREHTVRQLKYSRRYCNSTAAYTTHRNCSAMHTQASQIHSESAQTLRMHTDIALAQLPAHIAITQPCTHYASQLKYCKHTAAYIKHCICTAVHTKHRKYTASQLKYYEYTATYIKDRKYTAVHTKHPKYTASQLKDCE